MKKVISAIIAIICVLGITFGCVYWYKSATKLPNDLPNEVSGDKLSGDKESGDFINNNNEIEVSNNPIFTLENYPKVDASLAIHPLVDSIASDFLRNSKRRTYL